MHLQAMMLQLPQLIDLSPPKQQERQQKEHSSLHLTVHVEVEERQRDKASKRAARRKQESNPLLTRVPAPHTSRIQEQRVGRNFRYQQKRILVILHEPGSGPRRRSIQRTSAGTLAHDGPDVETWHHGSDTWWTTRRGERIPCFENMYS
ncbi:hypothetical protein ONS96_012594 [Cadophora gregata f. sp. sojae]|nr:hypothetical protein ONS96_012594 [Cadophora gregata f. sp. sojae]